MLKKIISFVLSFTLIVSQPVFAQGVAQLNLGNYLRTVGSSMAMDKFRPLHMRYFSYDAVTDNFQLLLDKGDNKDIKEAELEEKTKVLMEYFKIGLALPNEKFWVNLRPDAQDQIIDPELERTDMGKIMLEADLQLKKDTAGLTSPQNPEGKAYWDKLYKKAGELFGSENITIPTITRPWIVPGEIILRQGEDSAYIFKANMKVMLEHDYLNSQSSGPNSKPLTSNYNFSDPRMKELNEYSSQLIRELIIPRLTKEVNTSKRYAALRQVFFSLVMARWFKDTFGNSGSTSAPGTRAPENSYVNLVDSGDLTNLTSKEAWSKSYYFNEYKKSFEKGEYSLKEEIATPTGQVIRSYVSGGIVSSSIVNNGFEGFKKSLIPIFLSFVSLFSGVSGNSRGELTSVAAAEVINESALYKLGETLRKRMDQLKNMPDSPQKQKALESLEKIKNSLERVNKSGAALENEARKTLEDMISEATKGGDLLLQELNNINKKLENVTKENNQKTEDVVKRLNADTTFLKEWNKIERELRNKVEALSVELDGNLEKELAGILEFMLKQGNSMKIPETQNERIGEFLELLKGALSMLRANPNKNHPTEEETVRRVLSIVNRNLLRKSSSSLTPFQVEIILVEAFRNEKIGAPTQEEVEEFLGKITKKHNPGKNIVVRGAESFAYNKAGKLLVRAEEVAKKMFVSEGDILSILIDLRGELGRNPTEAEIIKKVQGASSAVGGIDFRQMNYLVQPMGSFKDLSFGLPILTSSALEKINLDVELEKLRDMVKNGMLPSGMRVKEYLAACFQKGKIEEKQDDLLVCLAEIYRLAEEENLETSPELRESLVIVDTGKFVLLPNNQKAGLN